MAMRVTHRNLRPATFKQRSKRLSSCAKMAMALVLALFTFAYIYFIAYTVSSSSISSSISSSSNDSINNVRASSSASRFNITTNNHDINNNNNGKQLLLPPKATVAYAVSVTGCGSDPITEGAAVLKHAIHRVSSRNSNSGGQGTGGGGGRYDYALFAIYHPNAEACALPLQALGYNMMRRDVFVNVSDIQGDYLREKIESNGCCGEKELIKLEAYTLTDYPIVVHLDLDVLILKPMDEIFDMMLLMNSKKPAAAIPSSSADVIMWPDQPLPETGAQIQAMFTMDYNMVGPGNKYKPVQGGFLVIRPDMAVYQEFREIVRIGDFQPSKGWGGVVGPFHGSMTFQGLIPYYYNVLHTGHSIELNRCIYNQMADNPRTGKTINDIVSGSCRVGTTECEDCRSRPIEDVVTTHFTLCQKPWWCLPHTENKIQHRLCRKLTHEWYKIRSELEESWGRPAKGPGSFDSDQFYGYCKSHGKQGYIPIEMPYGGPVDQQER